MLSAESLTYSYTPGRPVLRGVGLALTPGRLTALVGPNGSGKSTLLRLLAGLITPDEGTVTLDGKPVRGWTPAERAARLACITQRPDVAFGFTVRDVVRFGLVSAGRHAETGSAVAGALDRVGLLDRADEPFAHLSVGQQQRVSLARALAQLTPRSGSASGSGSGSGSDPAVLLADEPCSAMDPRHAIASMRLLRGLVEQGEPRAVLAVLHDFSLAARFADDAVLLDDTGRVAAAGSADRVLTPGCLAPVFGVGFARVDRPVPALLPTDPLTDRDTDEDRDRDTPEPPDSPSATPPAGDA